MRPLAAGAILLSSLFAAACQLTPTFTTGYEVEPSRAVLDPIDETLVVIPFSEEREPRYYNAAGRLFLTYVPFVPYVTLRFERLEESIQIQSDGIEAGGAGMTRGAAQRVAPAFESYYYPNSFARAIAGDLKEMGLFRDVVVAPEREAGRSRYALRGTLRRTPLRNTTTSFGLGMAGVLLWLVPVPMAKTTAEIALDLALTDNETGEVVWKRSLESELHRYITFYTSSSMLYGRAGAFSFNLVPPPRDAKVDRRSLFSWHFEALRRAMLESRADLARTLSERR